MNKIALSVISLVALPNLAFAQTPDETVIVIGKAKGYSTQNSITATKTDTPLIDIPQSINVVGRAQLEDQAHHSMADVLHYTAGVTVGQGEGNRDQITIRGQNTSADFFIDGVRDDVQYFRNLYNIERVEILKGPYSMIFGRGGGGGIINRVQKAPIATRQFIGTNLSANSFGGFDFGLDFNQPLSENSAVRVNAFFEEMANHRDFSGGQRYAINPYFAFKLNDNWVGAISYEYVNDDRVADRGIPSLGARPISNNRETFFGVPGVNNTNLQAHIAKVRIDGQLSATLNSTTTVIFGDYDKSYTNVFANGAATSQNGTVALAAYTDPTQRQNLIAQSNLIWDFEIGQFKNKILLGVEYGEQATNNQRKNGVLSSSLFNLASPTYPTVTFPAINRSTHSDVTFASVYAQNQISLNQYFDLVLGLRFDRFEINGSDFAATPVRAFARKDQETSPRIGLIFKPNEEMRIYASYSKSFLPRSGDQFTTLSPVTENLAPEEFTNFEVGAKWDIRPNLSLTAAIFALSKTNATTPNPFNPTQTINIGETNTNGFEIAIAGQISEAWQISGGYSYQDASLHGNSSVKLAQVPQNQFALWNRYNFSRSLGIGLGYVYQSEQYATILTSPLATRLPAFGRLDAAVFYNFSNGLRIQLNVENIGNIEYYPDAHNNNNISTGAPLNARVSISRRF
ncbi:MAG: iron complex outermembrane recepter protein [Hyphomonadaceae bacterium]|nr:MAG: iron complex outermembrane recepter protein [Hyphomonadaceae bacterium]KAF0184884.1 MAG: iron complex outermembrane recepter protein [Hyphomonadaceae bacterium]